MPASMRIWLLFTVAILGACGHAAFDRAPIDALLTAQQAAWNHGDLEGYMAGYLHSDALIFTSGGKIRRGWQDAYDHYKARYASDPAAMGQLGFQIIEIDPIGSSGAIVLGRWTLTGTPHAGGGVFTVVLERGADGWRIVHDHTSHDAP